MDWLKNRLDEIRKQRVKQYISLVIDLSVGRTNEEIQITGSSIYVGNIVLGANCQVRLNEISSDTIGLIKFRKIESPFYRFYLTNVAIAGLLTLYVGIETENFKITDVSAPVSDVNISQIGGVNEAGTQIIASGGRAIVGVTVVHTVTAGKTLLLDSCALLCLTPTTTCLAKLSLRDAGDTVQAELSVSSGLATYGSPQYPPVNFSKPMQVSEGWDIAIDVATAGSFSAYVKGREI